MVDFTKDKSWAAAQVIENDANTGNIGKIAVTLITTDLDDIPTGFNKVQNTAPNSPIVSSGFLMTTSRAATNISQFWVEDVAFDRAFIGGTSGGVRQPWSELYHTSNAASLPLTTAFAPADDNARTLGDASGRWSEVFAGNGTINTSDAREKTEITPFTLDEIEASKQLANEIGTYKFLTSVSEKGDSARTHIGFTVQRAIEIMTANNLNPMSYGFICFNSWSEELGLVLDSDGEKILDIDGQPTYKAIKEAGDRYGFRYDQLNQFIVAGFNARLEAAGI